MNSEHHDDGPVDAGKVCAWIARRIEATRLPNHPGTALHAHGGTPDDATHLGAECTTTVLAAEDTVHRWFRVEVVEFDPTTLPVWQQDPLTALTRKHRAARNHAEHR